MEQTELDTLVLRAGVRTPTPSGLRSALHAAQGLVAQYTPPPLDTAPVADVDADPVVIRIGVDECWCAHCGAVIMAATGMKGRRTGHAADCCRRPQPVPATAVLKPWEFTVTQ